MAAQTPCKGPQTRQERVDEAKDLIFSHYDDQSKAFLDFVLSQYVRSGVSQLDPSRLRNLLELKYESLPDATQILGSSTEIRKMFLDFQQHLYARGIAG